MAETKQDIQAQSHKSTGAGSAEPTPEYPIMVRVGGVILSLSYVLLGYVGVEFDLVASNPSPLAILLIGFVYSLLLVGKVPLPIRGGSPLNWNVCKFFYSSTAWLSVCMGLVVPIVALVNLLTPEDPLPVAFGLGLIAGGIAVLIAGVGLLISGPKYLEWQDSQQEAFND